MRHDGGMTANLLAPGIPLPSQGSSAVRLTAQEITARMRVFLESVAAQKRYVYYSTLIQGFAVKQSRDPKAICYPDINGIREAALEQFNEEDAAAGRPFVSSVVLEARGEAMLPRQPFFDALAKARGVPVRTEEEKREAHLREFEAAKAHWNSNIT